MKESSTNLSSLFQLSNRSAVITGGAGLLGAEFCRSLAEAGANVVVADIDGDRANMVAEDLVEAGHRAIAVRVDVTSPDSVRDMVARTIETFTRLDVLVNSAALDPKFDPGNQQQETGTGYGAFETHDLDAWKQALDVNLTGPFLCCQAAVVPMLEQGKGTIINLSSIYGIVAPDQRLYQQPGKPAAYKPAYYPVTKSGILGLTRYLAAYYAGKNIRVNALSPGGVYHSHDEAFVQSYSARTVLGRMAENDEMNGALLFLASDASSYMTGANLVVDGGWSTW